MNVGTKVERGSQLMAVNPGMLGAAPSNLLLVAKLQWHAPETDRFRREIKAERPYSLRVNSVASGSSCRQLRGVLRVQLLRARGSSTMAVAVDVRAALRGVAAKHFAPRRGLEPHRQ